jgi:hypothetical protein
MYAVALVFMFTMEMCISWMVDPISFYEGKNSRIF